MPMLSLEPPILFMVSISLRRSRSDRRKTSAAVASVATATRISAATTNSRIVRMVPSSSFMTIAGCTIWLTSSADS